MLAAVLFGREDMRITEWPNPVTRPGDALVRVMRCGVCGSDLRTFFSGPSPRYRLPAILGHEFAGVITEVGEGVEDFQVGERVGVAPAVPCGECFYCRRGEDNLCRNLLDFGINFDGAFAELILIPSRCIESGGLVKLSEELTDELAVWGEPVGTVIRAQDHAQVGRGQIVTIIGDGPMGLLHTLVAKELGAARVNVIGHHRERLHLARKVGADLTAMEGEEVLVGREADVTVVAVGDGAAIQGAFDLTRDGGTIVVFGGSTRDSQVLISPYRLHYGEIKLMGSFNCTTKDFRRALKMLPRLNLRPLRPREVPLKSVVEGFRAANSREVIKVVIQVGSESEDV